MASAPEQSTSRNSQPDHDNSPDTTLSSSYHVVSMSTMNSEDSSNIVFDRTTKDKNDPPASDTSSRPRALSRASTSGAKKCWICIGESTEDDPNNPPIWREPCTCNLTAHEACLLDWVADLENPKNSKSKKPTKILCPQCKSEIKIARPRNLIVQGYQAADRTLGRLVLPGIGATLLGTLWAGAWVHGFQSVYLVFGEEHARQIFTATNYHKPWAYAYALIPLNLIFARTKYADFVLPSGTLFLLGTQLQDGFEIDMTIWPPLPSTVFACLPAVRSMYNWCYNQAFGELNKKWLLEVQPRHEEMPEGQEENPANRANAEAAAVDAAEEQGIVLQLEVNLGAADDEEEGQPAQANNNDGNANGQGANGQNGGVQNLLGDRGDEIVEGTSNFGQKFLGALAFPVVAAGMGGLLSLAIPNSWMSSSNWLNGRPGLLRNRWGRSVVGGCLFVVLKDAIVLYCRWKLAQSHRQRKIMDFDKKTKKYKI